STTNQHIIGCGSGEDILTTNPCNWRLAATTWIGSAVTWLTGAAIRQRSQQAGNLSGGDVTTTIGLNVVDGEISAKKVISNFYLLLKVAIHQNQQIVAFAMETQPSARNAYKEGTIETDAGVINYIDTAVGTVVVLVITCAAG
ncbi:hypothetical protein D0N87_27525, partial [Pseudomonas sp. ATCC 13867]